jgi:hypothetical protein
MPFGRTYLNASLDVRFAPLSGTSDAAVTAKLRPSIF